MSEPTSPPATTRVMVYALIGQDERLLLVESPEHDALPGGAVHTGKPVEHVLRETLVDQLGTTVAALDFCAVVEYDTTQPGHPATSELAFLFDVTLTNSDRLDKSAAQPHRWATERELTALQPRAVRDALIAGRLAVERPWRAWTP
jgi:ADP-ribose pyrophosphatase YjhB (NUDIX family)